MIAFAVYDPSNGRILRFGHCQDGQDQAQAGPGEAVATPPPGIDDTTHYVDVTTVPPAVIERPEPTITLSQVGGVVTLSGVNFGTVILVSGDASLSVTQDEADGTVELTFEDPGTYTITCEQFPEQVFSATVTV